MFFLSNAHDTHAQNWMTRIREHAENASRTGQKGDEMFICARVHVERRKIEKCFPG